MARDQARQDDLRQLPLKALLARLRGALNERGLLSAPEGGKAAMEEKACVQEEKNCPAAVLIPIVLRKGEASVLFTRRSAHLCHHPGQISFPGGQVEAGDASLIETALRETREEIGLDVARVELLGTLPDYVTTTGFLVTPVVGVLHAPFHICLNTPEVDEVFEVPLRHFLDPANHQRYRREIDGQVRVFYAMPYGDYFIWGVTAGILLSLYHACLMKKD